MGTHQTFAPEAARVSGAEQRVSGGVGAQYFERIYSAISAPSSQAPAGSGSVMGSSQC